MLRCLTSVAYADVIASATHRIPLTRLFFEEADRQRYLQLLLEYSSKHGLGILAYCLMTNHVHLVCIPERARTFGSIFRPLDLRYTQHINLALGLTGRLWQGRPFSCALDDEHLIAAVRYVERNPVRARMARKAEQYPWSSAGGALRAAPGSVAKPARWVGAGKDGRLVGMAGREGGRGDAGDDPASHANGPSGGGQEICVAAGSPTGTPAAGQPH